MKFYIGDWIFMKFYNGYWIFMKFYIGDRIFMKFYTGDFHENLSGDSKFVYNRTKIVGHFTLRTK